MKLESTSALTTITYRGHQIHKTLAAHADVVQATGSYCSGLVDASIRIHAEVDPDNTWPLSWNLVVASPAGRTSMTISQHAFGAKVSFTSQ